MGWGPRAPQRRDFITEDTVELQNDFPLTSLLPHSVILDGSPYFFPKKMRKAFVTSHDANHNILRTTSSIYKVMAVIL